jgi:hypothetical protein
MFKILQRTVPLTKAIVCKSGSTVQKFKKGTTLITEVNYSKNHKAAAKLGLSKFRIEKTADGQKTFITTLQNSKGEILEIADKNKPYALERTRFEIKNGLDFDKNFLTMKICSFVDKLMKGMK